MPSPRIEAAQVSNTIATGAGSRWLRRWLTGIGTALVATFTFVATPAWADATEPQDSASAPDRPKSRIVKKSGKHTITSTPAMPAPGAKVRIETALYYDDKGRFLTGEKIKGKALLAPSPKQRTLRAFAAGDPPQPSVTPEPDQEKLVTPDDPETLCGRPRQYTKVPAQAVVAVYYGWTNERRGAGGNPLPDRTTPPQEGVSERVPGAPMYVEKIAATQHGRALKCAPPGPDLPCPYPKICVCKTYCSGSCCL